jgi:ATP-binding cassette subfamily B protein
MSPIRIFRAYKDLIGIMWAEAPVMVAATFGCMILTGLITPLGIYVNRNVFDGGLAVARGEMAFSAYSVFLVLFVALAILPALIEGFVYTYVEKRSLLILRTACKSRMLRKLKTMRYEHFESEASAEIIDKAWHRLEISARHMWPLYVHWRGAALIAGIGTLAWVFSIRWWLLLTVLVPYIIETWIASRTNYNIYNELETYWKKERKYTILGSYLRDRIFAREMKAYGNADHLIDTYAGRLNERNRDYERYYFKHLRNMLFGGNISKFSAIANVILLLVLFIRGEMTVGLFIAMSSLMYREIYDQLDGVTGFFKWSGYHINTWEYKDKFLALSDEPEGTSADMPESLDIEFRDVWFRYPGTDRDILKGLTFTVRDGEKASIVGENGEGKSTMIKLLLGLYTPDRGEIRIGGRNLADFPPHMRAKLFGAVFQDFPRYSITLKENIGIGDIDTIGEEAKIREAARKGNVDAFADTLSKGYDTLLGRDFEGGVDLSGGQWQRIAIARALMGDKPILILDEPTSQLDPVAEADLYREFAAMAEDRTALFITHRLGSTMITDRIFVIDGGRVAESGTHDELMRAEGIYARMFNAQKQWYQRNEGKEATARV